jgi:hypothetical protein
MIVCTLYAMCAILVTMGCNAYFKLGSQHRIRVAMYEHVHSSRWEDLKGCKFKKKYLYDFVIVFIFFGAVQGHSGNVKVAER